MPPPETASPSSIIVVFAGTDAGRRAPHVRPARRPVRSALATMTLRASDDETVEETTGVTIDRRLRAYGLVIPTEVEELRRAARGSPVTPMIKVLIVDDIPDTRDHLSRLLGMEREIDVAGTASSGEEAIQMAMEMRPDIIVMDINMPGMDGVAAAEIISQRLPNSPVIMMSVHGEAEHLKRAMLAGAREFLVKPFSADEFATSIKRVYERELVRREQMQATRDASAPPAAAGQR